MGPLRLIAELRQEAAGEHRGTIYLAEGWPPLPRLPRHSRASAPSLGFASASPPKFREAMSGPVYLHDLLSVAAHQPRNHAAYCRQATAKTRYE
jgi:hypothetical protein